MRKLVIAGALAAFAWAQGVRAEDPQEAKAEAQEKVQKAEAKAREETHEAQADAQKKTAEAQQEAREEKAEAQEKVQKAEAKAREGDAATGTATASRDQKKHPAFEGKDNFEVKGRIASMSASSITIRREELPAAKLRVDRNTKIELDGQHVSASQLKAGQDVKASFNLQDDKPMAVEIKAEKMNK